MDITEGRRWGDSRREISQLKEYRRLSTDQRYQINLISYMGARNNCIPVSVSNSEMLEISLAKENLASIMTRAADFKWQITQEKPVSH